MKKSRFIIYVTSIVLVAGGAAGFWFNCSRAPSQRLRDSVARDTVSKEIDEYAVYSALLEGYVGPNVKSLAISDATFYSNPDYVNRTTAEERIQELKQFCPAASGETLSDFDAKQMHPSTLTANFTLPVKYTLLDETELKKKGPREETNSFYDMGTGASGMIKLSRVGFNNDRNEAFLRVEYVFCPLCSHGGAVLLRKQGGDWTVACKTFGWES